MITIVCCYNNDKMLNDFVLESLKHQSVPYELALIDTRKNNVKSAAQAYNETLDAMSDLPPTHLYTPKNGVYEI